MAAATVEFEFPDDLDDARVVRVLGERLRVEQGRPSAADRVLLDTFDGRLRARGLRCEWPGRRTPTRRLTLHEPGAPVRRADVADGPSVGVAGLPAGPLRDRLADVLQERALLPVVRVRSRMRRLSLLNDDEKTVVRLAIERSAVVGVRGAAPLAPRLVVERLRGYDAEFDGTVRRLRAALGLVPAERLLFDAAVIAAGGRPEGVSSKVRVGLEPGMRADVAAGTVLGRLLEVAATNVPGTLEDLDTEFLHDLRVSIRRARSVLREFVGVHPDEPRARLRTELRWAQALTGPVRDLDVQLLEWDALTRQLTTGSADDLEPLRRLLGQRRARELARLRRGLRGRRFAALLEAWHGLAEGEGGESAPRAGLPVEVVAGDRIRRVYGRMVRDGRTIGDDSPDTALHELRKRGKELRYLLEPFGGLYPRGVVEPMVSALKDLQDGLGRFQDRAVQAQMLRASTAELAAQPGGPDAVLAVGLLIAALDADQRAARAAFSERFDAFASRTQRRLVRDTFQKAERP